MSKAANTQSWFWAMTTVTIFNFYIFFSFYDTIHSTIHFEHFHPFAPYNDSKMREVFLLLCFQTLSQPPGQEPWSWLYWTWTTIVLWSDRDKQLCATRTRPLPCWTSGTSTDRVTLDPSLWSFKESTRSTGPLAPTPPVTPLKKNSDEM